MSKSVSEQKRINKIPFWERFKTDLLRGDKIMTTRSKKYGNKGDRFEAFGHIFEITCVKKLPISLIVNEFYEEEGFESPDEFIRVWEQIHPKVGYQPEREYYLHLFKKVGEFVCS